ncbi:MAG: RNA polymerase sigma factor [bacterium]|nr:RNA polymerase sigma factor [bacterium]MCP5068663.1 RNA polymerase sigma factor [bacterium]
MAAPHAEQIAEPKLKILATDQVTDEQLVARVVEGDRAPFELLYTRYFPRVYRFVDRRVSNRADTEEIVQEVFFNLFSSLHSFRGEAPFAAWVFGLTRRTIASRFKRKRHEMVPLPEDEQFLGLAGRSGSSPHADYECAERLDQLSEAAKRDLSDEQWRLFRMHHLEDRTIQEIAGIVAKSEDAVKSHLYRARRMLLAR